MLKLLATPAGMSAFTALVCALAVIWEARRPALRLRWPRGRRWPAHAGLFFISVGAGLLTGQLLLPLVLALSLPPDWGLLRAVPLPLAIVLTVLLLDGWQYAFHRLMHAVPLFWRLHRVHHSDRDYDATTGLRFHPGEAVLATVWRVLPIVALGIGWQGLLAFAVLSVLADALTHANRALPSAWERSLSWLLVTPGWHRLHHAQAVEHHGRHYGTVFTLWDRLFATASAAQVSGRNATGLAEIPAPQTLALAALLLQPLRFYPLPATPARRNPSKFSKSSVTGVSS